MEISNEELLKAVKATLTQGGQALPNTRLVHGQFLRKLNGYFISQEKLKEAFEDYIKKGYFTVKDNNLNITELGIEELKINS